MAINPNELTDEIKEAMVTKPKRTHILLMNIHVLDATFIKVTGMLARDTSVTAAARFRTKQFDIVLSSFFRNPIQNKVSFANKATKQIMAKVVSSTVDVAS